MARGRHWITFSGSAANVARGFRTEFRQYSTGDERHFWNATVPSVPEVLADVVASVEGVNDYYPTTTGRKLQPRITGGSGTHYLGPDDIATIYNLKPLYAAGFDSSGQTIAVIGQSDFDSNQIRTYRARFNLPTKDAKPGLLRRTRSTWTWNW